MLSAAASSLALFRPQASTFAPMLTNASAVARPMPAFAPVMATTLPVMSVSGAFFMD
jgi:hypothetical protein